jgi:cyclopropane fatty-acyl-phospholipid synthase-like methyltransferase
MNQKDYFAEKAKEWDAKSLRVLNAQNIAKGIFRKIELNGNEHLMDFGAGTGLLSSFLADRIKKITAVDFSPAMLENFRAKRWSCEVETLQMGEELDIRDTLFDGIISSMTLHHIEDIPCLFKRFHAILKPDGFVALGDLVKEDGSFHADNTGVMHFGFEKNDIETKLKVAGFVQVDFEVVHEIVKTEKDETKKYPIFLLTGKRG